MYYLVVVRDRKYTRQHPGLDIAGYDGISDKGGEIFSYFRNRGIKNIAIVGVYSNMCVLGRSFGIRQLVGLGFQVTLVRDLTDVMYDPRDPPYVSHARGAELVVEHIEACWCPSIESRDLNDAPSRARRAQSPGISGTSITGVSVASSQSLCVLSRSLDRFLSRTGERKKSAA